MLLTENSSISCNFETPKTDACFWCYAIWQKGHSSYFTIVPHFTQPKDQNNYLSPNFGTNSSFHDFLSPLAGEIIKRNNKITLLVFTTDCQITTYYQLNIPLALKFWNTSYKYFHWPQLRTLHIFFSGEREKNRHSISVSDPLSQPASLVFFCT